MHDGERVVAAAEVEVVAAGDGAVLRVDLHPRPELPPGAGPQVVDAVVTLPEVAEVGGRLHAAIPAGDAETLSRVQAHSDEVQAHLAGASSIVDAELRPSDP